MKFFTQGRRKHDVFVGGSMEGLTPALSKELHQASAGL